MEPLAASALFLLWLAGLFAGFVLGFYDGFFGPGTGSFWAIALVLNLKKATAHTKIFNFTSNVVALGAFLSGTMLWFLGACCWGPLSDPGW
jgi:uncharacterized membrane protein YfcA